MLALPLLAMTLLAEGPRSPRTARTLIPAQRQALSGQVTREMQVQSLGKLASAKDVMAKFNAAARQSTLNAELDKAFQAGVVLTALAPQYPAGAVSQTASWIYSDHVELGALGLPKTGDPAPVVCLIAEKTDAPMINAVFTPPTTGLYMVTFTLTGPAVGTSGFKGQYVVMPGNDKPCELVGNGATPTASTQWSVLLNLPAGKQVEVGLLPGTSNSYAFFHSATIRKF